jgi:hypothetical protein
VNGSAEGRESGAEHETVSCDQIGDGDGGAAAEGEAEDGDGQGKGKMLQGFEGREGIDVVLRPAGGASAGPKPE